MIFQRFESKDRKIFGVAILLLLLSISLTIFDDWVYTLTDTGTENLEKIGAVEIARNDVRRRYKIAFSWNPLKSDNNVFQGDTIFTGDGSEAIIKTKTGEEIKIAPNSLVVISTRKDSISIEIGFGSFEGKVGNGKKLLVSSNNSITELDGSNAKVKVDAGDGSKILLNVLAGEVKVRSSDGEAVLKRNEAAELDGSGAIGQPALNGVQILSPLADQRIRFKQDLAVEFKWKSSRKISRAKIKVATDPEFKRVIVDSPVENTSYVAFNLPEDQPLYWQILSQQAKSEVTQFYVLDVKPPVPVSPRHGSVLYYTHTPGIPDGAEVDLEWAGGSPARRYEVQLAKDASGANVLKTLKTEQRTVSLGLLARGNYFWRVRGTEFKDAPWSQFSAFRVGPEPSQELLPPRLEVDDTLLILTKRHYLPAEKIRPLSRLAARPYIESYPTFTWANVDGADTYDLEISRSPNFRSPLVKIKTRKNSYQWKTAEPGTYYWRLRSNGTDYKRGSFSPGNRVAIRLGAPEATSESDYLDQVPDPVLLKAPPPTLELAWNPTVFTDRYEVIFSGNPQFTSPLRFVTERGSRKIQLPAPGTYFWRVRSLDGTGNPLSDFSRTYRLTYQRVYKDPALSQNLVAIYPKQEDSILLVGSGQSEVLFQWNKPFKRANYEIEIAYDMNFKDVAYRQVLSDTKLIYKKPFKNSVIYWRLRGITPEGPKEWTAANRFFISYEQTPFDAQTSELLYASRLKAKERQQRMLAEIQRKLQKLRSPAGTAEIQLDTPVPTFVTTSLLIKANIAPDVTPEKLRRQSQEDSYKQVKNPPVFTWKKVAAARRYFIEIAADRDFKDVIIKSPCMNTYYLWDTVRPGEYFWRVQAFNEKYTRSDYSPTQTLRVKVPTPRTLSPDNFVEIFNDPRDMWTPPAPFKLEWTPTLFAKNYEVEFGEDPSLSVSKTFQTDAPEREFQVSKTGTYYWRVRSLNTLNVGISEWSPVRAIEVAQTGRSPASVTRLTGLFPLDRTMIFVGKGLMNLVFHYVAPNPTSSTVEVSTTPDFKSIVARGVSSRGQVRIQKDLPEGKLYWRVGDASAPVDARGPAAANKWSEVYEFFLKKEPDPYQKAQR